MGRLLNILPYWKVALIMYPLFLCFQPNSYADQTVILGWDANTEPNLAGYRLYQSDTSGVYTFGAGNEVASIPAGTETVTLNNVPGGTWYWVLTTYDTEGFESGPSSEVSGAISTSGDSGGDDGCFIATAAYGSPIAKQVVVLRNFRDNILLKNSLGRIFVKSYHEVAPPLAAYIGEHETLRTVARLSLVPVVYGVKYPKTSVLIFLSIFIAIALTLRLRRSNRI